MTKYLNTLVIFLPGAKYYYELGKYKMTSFHLHQTCENIFYTLRLLDTLNNITCLNY